MWLAPKHQRVMTTKLGDSLEVWRCLDCRTLRFQLWRFKLRQARKELLFFGEGVEELWARVRRGR